VAALGSKATQVVPKAKGYLYVILDLFSRYVVGWMVAPRETAALAQTLIDTTCQRQGIEPDQSKRSGLTHPNNKETNTQNSTLNSSIKVFQSH